MNFLAACVRGDRATAERLPRRRPGPDVASFHPGPCRDRRRRRTRGRRPGRRHAGPRIPDRRYAGPATAPTALHTAANSGRADVVRSLLAAGADIDARDAQVRRHGPLSWATVGSGHPSHHHDRDRDWVATVQALLDAGADTANAWISAKPPSDDVAALLLAHGISPSDDSTGRP